MPVIYFLSLFLFSFQARSNQTAVSDNGHELRWASSRIPIVINTNSQTMNSSDTTSIISNSMAQWNSTSPNKVEVASSANSRVQFLQDFGIYGSGVIGITELSYNASGVIYKGSIYLNEENFVFNTNRSNTVGSNRIYLGDVLTHELGHLFGLSHSEVLNSSMFYSSFLGQSTVSEDDKAAIQQKYASSSFGTITGHVRGGNQIGVMGVHVQAISRNTGEVISTISNESGYFKIGGLALPDTYYLYTSPLKNLASLPENFSNVQTEFCPGNYVGTFFTACGGEGNPQGISLSSFQKNIDVGVVSIGCSLSTTQAYHTEKIKSVFSPVTVFDYEAETKYEKSFVGFFRNAEISSNGFTGSDTLKIDLSDFPVSGSAKYVQIKLLSQPFGSPVEYTMDVLNQNISLVGDDPIVKSQVAPEYIFNVDLTHLEYLSTVPDENVFELLIQAKKLSAGHLTYTIPSYRTFVSENNWPYLINISLMEMTSSGLKPLIDTAPLLSDNAACLDAPFTYAVSNSIPASQSEETSREPASVAACGTIDPPSNGNTPSASLPLLAVGFFLSYLTSVVIKRGKKFLS